MDNTTVNNQNLFLKLHLHWSPQLLRRDISVDWFLGGSNYKFSVGSTYLPTTLVINRKGALIIETGNEIHRLENDSSVLINSGTKFNISYASRAPADALFVFFGENFIQSNLNSLKDDEFGLVEYEDKYFERVIRNDETYNRIYNSVINDFDRIGKDIRFFNEKSEELFLHLIGNENLSLNEALRLPLKKKATRREMYRRLCIGADYIESCFTEELTLDDISKRSAISKFHFLRLFKSVFYVTPSEYIVSLRMKKAKELLRRSDRNVSEVCSSVGYESLPSFSNLFKKHAGCSPQDYRLTNRALKKAI
jgi:AraC family transcriptional regulator